MIERNYCVDADETSTGETDSDQDRALTECDLP